MSRKCLLKPAIFIIERLQSAYNPFTIIFSGMSEDQEMKKRIDRFALRRNSVLHADDFKLITAASLLSLSGLYIGNDSGFTHLAAATGCPAIALFGPTDPEVWKPVGRRVEVISTVSRSLEEISTDAVFERAVSLISRTKNIREDTAR